jgi:hypothetical protein
MDYNDAFGAEAFSRWQSCFAMRNNGAVVAESISAPVNDLSQFEHVFKGEWARRLCGMPLSGVGSVAECQTCRAGKTFPQGAKNSVCCHRRSAR